MIIKLAEFESSVSEMEKEAGLWQSVKNVGSKAIAKPGIGLEDVVDEIAKKKNWTKDYTVERLGKLGLKSKDAINDITGLPVTSSAAAHANNLIDHMKRNAHAYAGAGILAGGGAALYNRNKKK